MGYVLFRRDNHHKMITTLRDMLTDALDIRKETWDDIVSIAIGKHDPLCWDDQESESDVIDADTGEVECYLDMELDRRFDNGFGETGCAPFTAWTEKHVYFPVSYDGSEWVSSVPRNPNGVACNHVGIG